MSPAEHERFWAKVNRVDGQGCWLWTARLDGDGYGSFSRRGSPWKAHRVSWAFANGPIPKGMHVLHHCDVRHCVRPDHLFLGTNADNIADMLAKGRQRRGMRHGSAKLNEGQVLEIRWQYAAGGISQRALARRFGISRITLRHILNGDTWKHLGTAA